MTRKHPAFPKRSIVTHPFEAFLQGSWQAVKHVKIEGGNITVQLDPHGTEIEEKVIINNLRIRSRKANTSDCRCFLRPSMEVCVYSTYPNPTISEEKNVQPAWHDAKIVSIERKPHRSQCMCQFSVVVYGYQHKVGKRKYKLHDCVIKVSIENIAILQKLSKKSYEDGRQNWKFREDCSSVDKSMLPRGTFVSEVSWLLVLSILNGMKFSIKSIRSKMEYLIVKVDHQPCGVGAVLVNGNDPTNENSKCKNQDMFPSGSDGNLKAIHFQRNNGTLQPKIETLALAVPLDAIDVVPIHNLQETELNDEVYYLTELRYSKRRKVMPDRYVDCSIFQRARRFSARPVTPKKEDVSLPATKDISDQVNHPKEETNGEKVALTGNDASEKKFQTIPNKTEQGQGNSVSANRKMHQNHHAVNHVRVLRSGKRTVDNTEDPQEVQHPACPLKRSKKCHRMHDNTLRTGHPTCTQGSSGFSMSDNASSTPNKRREEKGRRVEKEEEKKRRGKRRGSDNASSTPNITENCPHKPHDTNQDVQHLKIEANHIRKAVENSYKHHHGSNTPKTQTRKISETKDTESCSQQRSVPYALHCTTKPKSWNTEFQRGIRSSLNRSKKKDWHEKIQGVKESSSHKIRHRSEKKRDCGPRIFSKKIFSETEWTEVMERCMQNIKCESEKKHPDVVSQWEENKVANTTNQSWKFNWTADIDDPIEMLENEDLWKDMENSMAVFHSLNDNQEPSTESSDVFGKRSCKGDRRTCRHEYKLDEEIGIVCKLCNLLQTDVLIRSEDKCDGDKRGWVGAYDTYDVEADTFLNATSRKDAMSECYNNVWALIPDFKVKLHDHQKMAFEFLWKNIVGSLNPKEMESVADKCGGCVIAHSPGTGKTLLIISFLVSYLKLFPGERPLILAPKTTVYAWYKEFKKWDLSLPVYQIHTVHDYINQRRKCKVNKKSVSDLKLSEAMMHLTDCLEKLLKWHAHPSILLMSYPSFWYMTREDSKFKHRRYMARVLRESPGILILDEGHNPRSTKSKLRKVLMEVKTNSRILLSGTLFQNNFEEYFNTLCLARPAFISEVVREFNLRVAVNGNNGKQKVKKNVNIRREMLARRTFVEQIGERINSSIKEEMKCGLSVLNKITNSFIDVYDGGNLDRLPGLQCYTLLMKSSDVQQQILSKLDKLRMEQRCSLELELLITAGSIHPWLIKSFRCSCKYFISDELERLEIYRHDIKKGPKVMFVIELMHHCIVEKEKVLIFCRNIPPINLFVEIFNLVFGWQKDREVLVLQGELDMGERAKVVDKFQESSGPSRVLLASTTACAEGINLTAASRVVLLDSEWNPSKIKQAIARAFRLGQEKVVYVYRLLASGTMENEKYHRNELKERMSRMIFTDGCVDNSYRKIEEIDDDGILRKLVKAGQKESFEMIMKCEKGRNSGEEGKNKELH